MGCEALGYVARGSAFGCLCSLRGTVGLGVRAHDSSIPSDPVISGVQCLALVFDVLCELTKIVTLRIQVRVVEHRRSKKLFALKYIDKAQCSKQRAVANVIQERRLLEEVRLQSPGPGFHLAD